jgi:CBS domain-containing protein
LKIFKTEKISRLPVVDGTKLVGIITWDDIIERYLHPVPRRGGQGASGETIGEKDHVLLLPVYNYMSEPPELMSPDSSVRDVVGMMHDRGWGGMLLGEEGILEGVVTRKDLLRPLASGSVLEPFVIQFVGEERLSEFDRGKVIDEIQSVFEKLLPWLRNGHLSVSLNEHEKKLRGFHLIHVSAHLSSPRGSFAASVDAWGSRLAVKRAVDDLERQLKRKKNRR